MTQADGITPTPTQVREQMRLIKPVLERLELALTAAARLNDSTSVVRRFRVLADLTEANEALHAARLTMETVLGLPYDAVIENVSYTAIFGPDD